MSQILRSSRLWLRTPQPQDLAALTAIWTDPGVARFMVDYGPRTPAATADWLAALPETADPEDAVPTNRQYVLERRADRAVVGWLGMGVSTADVAEWDVGYAVHPAHRGHGYATEALTTALGHCVRDLGIASVWGECAADNEASARVMLGAGMSEIDRGQDGHRRFVLAAVGIGGA